MKKKHATEDEPGVMTTLCGMRLSDTRMRGPRVDNADPTCGRCLRIINARIAAYNAGA